MTDAVQLEDLRSRAFDIAYRMLGSVADAEDIAQESLLRVQGVQEHGDVIRSPLAFVATVATRLSLDELRSARVRRETYVGTWLPEPLITEEHSGDDPQRSMERAESLSVAFLVLLESLTPDQRAVLLLRDVFDYDYEEIATMLDVTEANARQIGKRARQHVLERRPRFEASREEREQLAQRFFAAARTGDLAGLEALLSKDAVLYGDGGGKVPAITRPQHGRARVAHTLVAWSRAGLMNGAASLREVQVNGMPGAVLLDRDGRVLGVLTLGFAGGCIGTVTSVVNPEKLRHMGEVGDLLATVREGHRS